MPGAPPGKLGPACWVTTPRASVRRTGHGQVAKRREERTPCPVDAGKGSEQSITQPFEVMRSTAHLRIESDAQGRLLIIIEIVGYHRGRRFEPMTITYIPAEVFAPGEYLRNELDERGSTVTEFAEIIGRPVQAVSEILNGEKESPPRPPSR